MNFVNISSSSSSSMVHCGTARALPGKVHTNSAVSAGGGVGGMCYYLEYSRQVIEMNKYLPNCDEA